ncbi:hypothetical protein DPMN_072572 [Dreissena polymorpha]|uniref:Uncharacterized protein n=1 Tax=Dreissena polymorpha TaxID=45954 RepID=A0A9D3Z4N3_DREPO|nr:hypothetical protein DPMN_072572 [Dreissena polymorpha]
MLSGNLQTNMLATPDHVSNRQTEERPTTVNQYDWVSYIDILPSTCNNTATTSTETPKLATSCVQCYEIIPEMQCLPESVEVDLPGIPGQDIARYENLRRSKQDEMSVYTEI